MTSVALAWSSAVDLSDLQTASRRGGHGTPGLVCYNNIETRDRDECYTLRDLQFDFSRERDPIPRRVNRWLRQIARSEGHHVPFEEDDMQWQEHFTATGWQEWGTADDWLRAMDNMGPVEPDPLANDSDPKLLADFHFVEKTARKRKMSQKDARRLHIVFRAPTEEKIKRIKEMVQVLLPLVLLENTQNRSGSSCTSR